MTRFRPPKGYLGGLSPLLVRLAGLETWLWSVDPCDWRPGTTVEGLAGERFCVQYSTNFSNWVSLTTNTLSGTFTNFTDTAANAGLLANWGVTKDWKETSRYEQKTQPEALALVDAIDSKPDGVLEWIRNHW